MCLRTYQCRFRCDATINQSWTMRNSPPQCIRRMGQRVVGHTLSAHSLPLGPSAGRLSDVATRNNISAPPIRVTLLELPVSKGEAYALDSTDASRGEDWPEPAQQPSRQLLAT